MPPMFGSTSPEAAAHYADEFDRYDLFLVAEEDGRFVGAACGLPLSSELSKVPGLVFMKGEYLLVSFAVDREHRGKGIGKALLDKVKLHCMETGRSMLSLWAGSDYYPAIEFYIKNGFALSGWIFPPGCKYDQCRIFLTWRP